MWIETGILFWFMESSLFSFSSSCSAFWIEVELALCGRWKTRDGARVPPGISKAKPLSSKNSSLEKSIRFHLKKQKRSPDALFTCAPGTFVL